MGRGGVSSRNLSEDSGARIDILRDKGEYKVSGTSEAVESVLKAIKAILKKDADTVNEAFDCDSSRFDPKVVGDVMWRGYSLRWMIEEWQKLRETNPPGDYPWDEFIYLLYQ